jgi:hydroxyacylglutathione hydrolase
VMETPGHTAGGIVLVGEGSAEGVAFVGDTLFAGSCGRTDLPTGDAAAMVRSLSRLATELAPATTVLCGHGPATTMERELKYNPNLQL